MRELVYTQHRNGLDFMFCKIPLVCFKLCGYSKYQEQVPHEFVIVPVATKQTLRVVQRYFLKNKITSSHVSRKTS